MQSRYSISAGSEFIYSRQKERIAAAKARAFDLEQSPKNRPKATKHMLKSGNWEVFLLVLRQENVASTTKLFYVGSEKMLKINNNSLLHLRMKVDFSTQP